MMLNKIVPEGLPYRHSCEGPDDMVMITFHAPQFICIFVFLVYHLINQTSKPKGVIFLIEAIFFSIEYQTSGFKSCQQKYTFLSINIVLFQ